MPNMRFLLPGRFSAAVSCVGNCLPQKPLALTGANLALACDIVVAAETASFVQSFCKVGLIPDSGGTFFLPRLVGLPRATALMMLGEKISACYAQAYGNEPFIRLLEGKSLPDTKNVTGTNVCEIAWRLDPRTGRLVVMSAEDNLLKGASGQAIQCFNLMCGFEETAGLL